MSDKIKAFCALCLVVIAVGVGSIAIDLHNQNIEDTKVSSTPATIQPTKDVNSGVRFVGVSMSKNTGKYWGGSAAKGIEVELWTWCDSTNETKLNQGLILNFEGINGSKSFDYTMRSIKEINFIEGLGCMDEGWFWFPKDRLLEGFTILNNDGKKTFKFDSPLSWKFSKGTYTFAVNKTTRNLTLIDFDKTPLRVE